MSRISSTFDGTVDDSSLSLYYSFDVTKDKTLEADSIDCNSTLEPEIEPYIIATVMKKPTSLSPVLTAVPKSFFENVKVSCSTPTNENKQTIKQSLNAHDLGVQVLEQSPNRSKTEKIPEINATDEDKRRVSKIMESVIKFVKSSAVDSSENKENTNTINSECGINVKEVTKKTIRFSEVTKPKITTKRRVSLMPKLDRVGDNVLQQRPSNQENSVKNPMSIKAKELLIGKKSDGVKTQLNSSLVKKNRLMMRKTVCVKTTLHSPALLNNKRKSIRRSVNVVQNIDPSTRISRKSILPKPKDIKTTADNNGRKITTQLSRPSSMNSNRNELRKSSYKSTLETVSEKGISNFRASNKNEEKKKDTTKPLQKTKDIAIINYVCVSCSKSFANQNQLDIHKRTHIKTHTSITHKCNYCDKNFAIKIALDKHLAENCSKIPAAALKKIISLKTSSEISNKTTTSNLTKSIKSNSTISNANNDDVSTFRKPKPHNNNNSQQGSSTKKRIPHSGIYRTPSKVIACHQCKKNFDNILSYTEHMIIHSSATKN